ncbi:hypothetical protein [Kribbella hippodromi]|uniref:hypothetical protein n=1 Tax=Kribbella hippodromi TaxID=434347 RepID=UPI0031DEEB5C
MAGRAAYPARWAAYPARWAAYPARHGGVPGPVSRRTRPGVAAYLARLSGAVSGGGGVGR